MDTQVPARLQSDNGKEFVAGIILELCQAFGVTAINGAIGKPQSQGCVERSNCTVKDKISAQLQMAATKSCQVMVCASRRSRRAPAQAGPAPSSGGWWHCYLGAT